MRNDIKELQQQNEDLNNEIQRLHQENGNINNKIQQLHRENTSQNNEIQQLREENFRKSTENRQMDNEIREFRRKNSLMDNVIQQQRRANQKLREENTHMNCEITQYKEDNSKMRNDIKKLQQENGDLNNGMQRLRQENGNINNEIQQLYRENASKDNVIQQLREENFSNIFAESESVVVSNQVLGRGAYGTVYIGDFCGTKVAVKQFHDIILSPYNIKILTREIDIASQCRHPNLLQFLCAIQNDQNPLLIVTELMDMALRTLLEQRARQRSQLGNQEVKSISLDVARGLNYLHSKRPNPIIHRDISSANVLLWIENGSVRRAKISDYGAANFMQACNTANPGAAIYAAPEARIAQHDPKVSIFYKIPECCSC